VPSHGGLDLCVAHEASEVAKLNVSVRRGLWLVPLAVLSVLLGLAIYRTLPPPARITEANYAAIQEGITSDEVERVLGAPPGNYASKPLYASALVGGPPGHTELRKWTGDEGTIYLWFDSQSRVVTKAFHKDRL
jgi:hypothetical protein